MSKDKDAENNGFKPSDGIHSSATDGQKDTSIRRSYQDWLFKFIFSFTENLLALVKVLCPDMGTITPNDIRVCTLSPNLMKGAINDLSILVKNRLLLLVEAQSTWPENPMLRFFVYMSENFGKVFIRDNADSRSGTRTDDMDMDMYMIYTGDLKKRPGELRFSEQIRFRNGLDFSVKVMYGESKEEGIIYEYVQMVRILKENLEKYKDQREAVRRAIEECKAKDILADFLEEHGSEILADYIDKFLYDPGLQWEQYDRQLKNEGIEIGKEIGGQDIMYLLGQSGVIGCQIGAACRYDLLIIGQVIQDLRDVQQDHSCIRIRSIV